MKANKIMLIVIPVLSIIGIAVESLVIMIGIAGILGAIFGAIYANKTGRSGWLWGILCLIMPYLFPIILFFLKPKDQDSSPQIQFAENISSGSNQTTTQVLSEKTRNTGGKNIGFGIFWIVVGIIWLAIDIENEDDGIQIVLSVMILISGIVQLVKGIRQSKEPEISYASKISGNNLLTFNPNSDRVIIRKNDEGEEIEVKWIFGYSVTIINSGKVSKIKLPWLSDEFAEIKNPIDVNRFLSNPEIQSPVLNSEYTDDDKKLFISQWAEYLLAHPNSQVVVNLLDFAESGLLSSHPIQNNLAALMIVGNNDVKKAIASRFWHKVTDRDNFFTILNNRGRISADFPGKEIEQAMKIIKLHCPTKYMEEYNKYADEYFVPQSSE